MFNQGLAYDLQQQALTKGPNEFLNYISNPNREQMIRNTLGDDAFEAMHGRATADKFIAKVKPYQPWVSAPSRTTDIIRGGLGSEFLRNTTSMNLPGMAQNAAAWGASHAYDWLSHFQNRGQAHAMLDLIASDDPEKMKQLYKLVQSDPSSWSMQQNLLNAAKNTAYANAIVSGQHQGEQLQQPEQPVARASGGRVGKNHDMLVNRLMRLADKAKKSANSTTEPLLNVADEHIVKALKVANQAI